MSTTTARPVQERPAHPGFVNDRAAAWLGVEVLRAEFGDVLTRLHLREEMLNGYGMAQGGMVIVFADVAFALVAMIRTATEGRRVSWQSCWTSIHPQPGALVQRFQRVEEQGHCLFERTS